MLYDRCGASVAPRVAVLVELVLLGVLVASSSSQQAVLDRRLLDGESLGGIDT
jgi:hypothetical protein